MSLIVYATKIMNFYCGFQLTWKTCETFKKSSEEIGDQLLIKWFFLYTFIQLEGMLLLFLELIPFGFLVPFAVKSYIMLPHSKWHQFIYNMFEKLEMDEYTNAYTIYLTKLIKAFLVRFLLIIENCVDLVRVEDLNEIEIQVANIAQKIMTKKQSIEIRQSKIKIRKSEPKQQQQQQNKDFLSVQASVKDQNSFKDYTIVFNCRNSEVQFVQNNECVHRKTLLLIDIDKEKCLKALYVEDDGNLQLIKLKRSEDVDLWLKPVIEILIQKAQE